jgi:hypothetical protein
VRKLWRWSDIAEIDYKLDFRDEHSCAARVG